MIEFAGMQLGTLFSGGTFVTALLIAWGIWVKGKPDRTRAETEGKVAAAADAAERRLTATAEQAELYRVSRVEVHELRNTLAKTNAEQAECIKTLVEVTSTNRHNEAQMGTMMFLVRVLSKDLERADCDSLILQQAKVTLDQLGHRDPAPGESTALATAKHTEKMAEATVAEAAATVAEVERAENGK